ncbi:MAG: hypothetical protein J6B74_07480 [Ruminococcus sp.]|nr:hypothetical protein [Ruminococcus sp.]
MTAVTFNEKNERDRKILHDIEEYQKEKKLSHRIDAVRNLCEIALEIEKIMKGYK